MYLFVRDWLAVSGTFETDCNEQGGRLVTERRMVSDLFVFDLETFVWQRVPPNPGDDVPGARYFHSTDSCE